MRAAHQCMAAEDEGLAVLVLEHDAAWQRVRHQAQGAAFSRRGMSASLDRIRTNVGTRPEVTGFYDPATFSIQYVVADPATRQCAVIDPILDFDPKSGSTGTVSADRVLDYI